MKLKDLLSKFWVVAPLPTMNISGKYLDPFMNASWDFSQQAPILISVYADAFGVNGRTIVIGSWFLTVLAAIWIRSENAVIPMMITIILLNISLIAPGIIPEEWKAYIMILVVLLPVAAILYSIYKGR
jgi:hypothetical protein